MRVYGVYLLLALAGAQNNDTIDMKSSSVTATPFDRTGSSSGGGFFETTASISPKPVTNSDGDATATPSMMSDSSSTDGNRITPIATMTVEPTIRDTSTSEMPTSRQTKEYTPEPSRDVWPTREYSPYPTHEYIECNCDGTTYPTRYSVPSYDFSPYPSNNNRDTTWPTYEFTPYPSASDWGTSWGNTEQMTPYPTRDIWCPCRDESPLPSFSAKPTIKTDDFTVRPSFSAKPTIKTDDFTVRPSFSAKPTIKTDDFTVRPSFSAKPTIQTDVITMRPSFSAKPTIRTEFSVFPSIPPVPTFLSVSLRPTFIVAPTRFPPIDNRTKDLIAEIIKTREEIQSIISGVRGSDFNITRAQQFIADIARTFNSISQVATGVRDSIDDVQDSFRRIGALVLNVNKSAIFETRTLNFTLRAVAVDNDKKQEVKTEAGVIQLPILSFRNQSISVVEWKENPFRVISSREIVSAVISIMLSDLRSGNETRVSGLTEAINITMPLREFNFSSSKPVCVYWDKLVNDWSVEGCIVKQVSANGIVCGCTHLTDFSVLSVPIADSGISSGGSSSGGSSSPISGNSNSGSNLNVSNLPIIIGGAIGGLLIVSIIVAFIVLKAKDRKEKILTPLPTNNSVVNYLHSRGPSADVSDRYMIGPMQRNKSAAKISYKPNVIGGAIGSMV
jgi:hypothetical protein